MNRLLQSGRKGRGSFRTSIRSACGFHPGRRDRIVRDLLERRCRDSRGCLVGTARTGRSSRTSALHGADLGTDPSPSFPPPGLPGGTISPDFPHARRTRLGTPGHGEEAGGAELRRSRGVSRRNPLVGSGALGGNRTPNLLIRSQRRGVAVRLGSSRKGRLTCTFSGRRRSPVSSCFGPSVAFRAHLVPSRAPVHQLGTSSERSERPETLTTMAERTRRLIGAPGGPLEPVSGPSWPPASPTACRAELVALGCQGQARARHRIAIDVALAPGCLRD
jgi:hypothetical protein